MNNITFQGYYQALKNEKVEFIKTIQALTNVTERTVYNWIAGKRMPNHKCIAILCKHFNTDKDSLFPQSEKKEEVC